MDPIFPHHENELAQSCAACPESHISYWVHDGFVTVDDEKMSKSLGNFFAIREVKCGVFFDMNSYVFKKSYYSGQNFFIVNLAIMHIVFALSLRITHMQCALLLN